MTTHTLAIDGGSPVRTEPFSPWPFFAEDEIRAVEQVLRSGKVNYWTGTELRTFEKEYAEYLGAKHAVAVANGTVSLELLLRAAGVGEGDEVITTPRTFAGTATAIVAAGARPVFADVDPDSGLITVETIDSVSTPRTKAVIIVHLAGWVGEMDELMTLAEERGWFVIEDCAQSHGATYRGKQCGALGHAGSFSFCQDKILTTGGEGGLISTNDEEIWRRSWEYKDHGKSWEAVYEREHPPGYRWYIESFGTNWRMTEMQGAIGRRILPKLDDWVARRRGNARRLIETLREFDCVRTPEPPPHIDHAYYKLYAYAVPDALKPGWDRDRVATAIRAEGIVCMQGSCGEIYLEKAFDRSMRPPERLPVAQQLGDTSLMFLVHPTMTTAEIDDSIEALRKVLTVATR